MAIYVTSDAHGHVRALDEALSKISLTSDDTLYVLGDTLFSSPRFPDERRAWLFTLCAHKLLFLLHENQGGGLNDLRCGEIVR